MIEFRAASSIPRGAGRPTPEQVRALFNPRSIALIGATDKSYWSESIHANLTNHGFEGPVYLVNPRGAVVHGEQSYATIADLPDGVELAFVMVPTTAILDVLRSLAGKGIDSAVILTAGFGELGAEGAELERQVVEFATRRGMTLLGPNGNGYINAARNTTPYGLVINPPLLRGPVGVVLQSGALASSVLDFAQARNIGVSLLVSMGNEAMVTLTDAMRYLVQDPGTKVITLFVESVRQPEEFLAVAEEALAAGKPVVALKVGRSKKGSAVAKAHTGSLVGDDRVIDAVFAQHGVIRVDSLEDLIMTAGLLAETGPLPGNRIGFVTPSGGACEIIADRAEDEGLEIPDFAPATVEGLKQVVPDFATVHNPLDVTGYIMVNSMLLRQALAVVDRDPEIDVIVLATEPARDKPADPSLPLEYARGIADAVRACTKPVVIAGNMLVDITAFGREISAEIGYPGVLGGLHHAMTALGRAVWWSEFRRSPVSRRAQPPAGEFPLAHEPVPGTTWTEHEAAEFLAANGVPVVPQELVASREAAVSAAERLGFPVVVKLAAADVAHKSDIGGVRLGLASSDQVAHAYDAVTAAGEQAGASVLGAVIQPMRESGIELIVGVVRDPVWGLVLAVGLGGIWVEIMRDTALRVLPVAHGQVLDALRGLRGAALFNGARGNPKADLGVVADAVVAVAGLAGRLGERLESLEVNPLLVRGDTVEALDALITWR
ncbi:acetate--CoA ligase family protein [Streptomyces sp. NPDC051976]|uniref:acetate--CoA ligase family protein n=1 Tax=Streptomyces sp. NPDC051976 TaxID=3154947 RepID=UPI0034476275